MFSITTLTGLLGNFLTGIASNLATDWMRNLGLPIPVTIRSHFRQLVPAASEIPFIYKDLGVNVLRDFVATEMRPLNLSALSPASCDSTTSVSQRLRDRRHVLFLGQAGTGKTTFFRHTILALCEAKKLPYFYDKEDLVPVYVPLKLVDNTEPSPILKHILLSYRLFGGKAGPARWNRLVHQRRLFLLLDGYDEVAPSATNWVQSELNALFGTGGTGAPDRPTIDSSLTGFYQSTERCRLWLSSRREYLSQYPVYLPHVPGAIGTGTAVEVLGIGASRARFVKRIFDIYRERNRRYEELLSAEYFIQDIDGCSDAEIRALSSVPLFLTVMCYIYVKSVEVQGTYSVEWTNSIRELILECTKLLIRDLDEDKARGLPAARRAGIVRRRNDFPEEKDAFLPYFAAKLIGDSVGVFDLDYVIRVAAEFLSRDIGTPNRERALSSVAAGGTNGFVYQLVYSGLFVEVIGSRRERLYDFPHRRFREVLAAKYLEAPEVREVVWRQLASPGQRALFVNWFQLGSAGQREALERICGALLEEGGDLPLGDLLLECYIRRPTGFGGQDQLADLVRESVRRDVNPDVSPKMLDYLLHSDDLAAHLGDSLARALAAGQSGACAVATAVLARQDPTLLVKRLLELFEQAVADRWSIRLWLRYLAELSPEGLIEHIEGLFDSRVPFDDVCWCIVSYLRQDAWKAFLLRFVDACSAEQKATFCYWALSCRRSAMLSLQSLPWDRFRKYAALVNDALALAATGKERTEVEMLVVVARRGGIGAVYDVNELLRADGMTAQRAAELVKENAVPWDEYIMCKKVVQGAAPQPVLPSGLGGWKSVSGPES